MKRITEANVAAQADLEKYMSNKMHEMEKKVTKVNNLFHDTLLYSSKTYFLEEIYKFKEQTDTMKRQLNIFQQKEKLYKQEIMSVN